MSSLSFSFFCDNILICKISTMSRDYQKSSWQRQIFDIAQILKKSIQATQKYSQQIFQNQQVFFQKYSRDFLTSLKQTQQIKVIFPSQNIFNQLAQKLKALTQLFFPEKKLNEPISQLKLKHKRIQKLLRLIKKKDVSFPMRLISQNIKNLMKQECKLNMEPDLFIFKSLLIEGSFDSIPYRVNDPSLLAKKQQFPKQTHLIVKVIHGYFNQEASSIIVANLPTLGTYKTVFYKSMESSEVKEMKDLQQKGQQKRINQQSNQSNSKVCFNYFGHAMQFDFFNSLVQPVSLSNYIRKFSIIQDMQICRGLILGALDSLPQKEEPQLSDSQREEEWQDEVQKIARQFGNFFQGFFSNNGEQSPQVVVVARKIALLRREKNEPLASILKKYWCQ